MKRHTDKHVKSKKKLIGELADPKKHSDGFVSLAFSAANDARRMDAQLDAFTKGVKEGGERGIAHGVKFTKQQAVKAFRQQNETARLEKELIKRRNKSDQSSLKWKNMLTDDVDYANNLTDFVRGIYKSLGEPEPDEKTADKETRDIFPKTRNVKTRFVPSHTTGITAPFEITRRWRTGNLAEQKAYLAEKNRKRAAKPPKTTSQPPLTMPQIADTPRIRTRGNLHIGLIPDGSQPAPPATFVGIPGTPGVSTGLPAVQSAIGNALQQINTPGTFGTYGSRSALMGSGSLLIAEHPKTPPSDPTSRKLFESPTSETTVTSPIDTKLDDIIDKPIDDSPVDLNDSRTLKEIAGFYEIQQDFVKKT